MSTSSRLDDNISNPEECESPEKRMQPTLKQLESEPNLTTTQTRRLSKSAMNRREIIASQRNMQTNKTQELKKLQTGRIQSSPLKTVARELSGSMCLRRETEFF